MTKFAKILSTLLLTAVFTSCATTHEMRYPPVRWLSDNDREPIARPKAAKRAVMNDMQESYFQQLQQLMNLTEGFVDTAEVIATGGKQGALNSNNFGEVADSTWFENRIGRFEMSPRDVVSFGALEEPDWSGKLAVTYLNMVTNPPFMLAQDRRGDTYAIRFDLPEYGESIAALDLIAQRVMSAAGYNVPKAGIFMLGRGDFKVASDADIILNQHEKRSLTDDDLLDVITRHEAKKMGKMRSIVFEWAEGDTLGPFAFRGKRGDDKNDRIPHEHRRELRGLRVFLEFLGRADTDTLFPLDTFISDGGDKGYIKHYVASTIHVGKKPINQKYKFKITPSPRLGDSSWAFTKDEPLSDRKAGEYTPGRWIPRYSNLAFQNLTNADAFWASKIIMHFSDDVLHAIVAEAYAGQKQRAQKLAELIDRRDKTLKYWFGRIPPLEYFQLTKNGGEYLLRFRDLFAEAGGVPPNTSEYRCCIKEEGRNVVASWVTSKNVSCVFETGIFQRMFPDKKYFIDIEIKRPDSKWWRQKMSVIVTKNQDGPKIISVKR